MSIIYETLSRLEKEGTGEAAHLDRASLVSLPGRPTRSPARARATLMVLVLTGLGLALWLPNSPLSGFNQLMDKHPIIGSVRGLGLFIGVELVKNHLKDIELNRYPQVAKKTDCSITDIKDAMKLIMENMLIAQNKIIMSLK